MTRITKLTQSFPAELGAVIVTDPKNQYYLTGADFGGAGFVLVTREKTYLVTNALEVEKARLAAHPAIEVLANKPIGELLKETIVPNGFKSVAIEENHLTWAKYQGYQKAFGEEIEILPAGRLIDTLREFKDPEELATIRRAQAITDAAFTHILSYIKPTATERDIALELEFFMRQQGAEGMAFDVIAVSGKNSSLPHGRPRNVPLEQGFLTMDFGAKLGGYCSDMTRTVVIGKADDEMKLLYKTVLEAQLAAIEKLSLGISCADLDKAARDVVECSKFAGRFIHGLGHGVGLNIHEAPSVSSASQSVLAPGHIVTIEPGIYLEGKYGCRIEDMAVCTEAGVEIITKSPKELMEIG
ncbi:MAG: aminopeptidase P family protein [Oscillospiraceae bacterium]|nr:aminopeptidase P family protein [Oscillospiraceae bacterium]